MAEINEVFDDLGQNAKKLMKSKPFIIACIAVGLIALYVNFSKKGSSSSETEEVSYYDGTQAIGYAGYPGMGGSSGDSQYEWYLEELTHMQEEYDENLEKLQEDYDTNMKDMQGQLDSAVEGFNKSLEDMQNEYDKSLADILAAKGSSSSSSSSGKKATSTSSNKDLMAQWQLQQEYQADLAQMQANSELYNVLGNDQTETKKALHQANMDIASKYGFQYDGYSGNYFDKSGSVVYLTSQQKAKAITTPGKTTKETSSNKVSFDPNVDYQARINAAVASGASQATINQLQAQRQAKINAVYGGVDPNKK